MPVEYAFIETIGGRSALNPDQSPPLNKLDAVKEHLVLLLNTRRGSVAYLPDYGLPDLSEIYQDYPHSLDYLGEAIHQTIERYETRLTSVVVRLTSSSTSHFEAYFTIEGVLETEGGKYESVSFRTVVSNNGRTEVQ